MHPVVAELRDWIDNAVQLGIEKHIMTVVIDPESLLPQCKVARTICELMSCKSVDAATNISIICEVNIVMADYATDEDIQSVLIDQAAGVGDQVAAPKANSCSSVAFNEPR